MERDSIVEVLIPALSNERFEW